MTTPVLEVEHLVTSFSSPAGIVHAVDDVSFILPRATALGVVGESGSGKSVLARSIMRLLPRTAQSSGAVRLEGRDLTSMSSSTARELWGRDVAMVFQNPMTSLNPVMRIGRQITESLQLHLGLPRRAAMDRAGELLRMVGVPEPSRQLRAYPQELSGGMRQRVSIAIAIACSPALLLADEPTTALDVTIQRQILDLLSELQSQEHMAMILITHDLGVVAGRTTHVLVMYGGRVMEDGPTTDLFEDRRHPYTASLLAAIPKIDAPSHTRLAAIPGRPAVVIDRTAGCPFAPRCARAQQRCLVEDPPLEPVSPGAVHRAACFYPIGSEHGDEALERNMARGSNAAGLVFPDRSRRVA